MPGKTSRRRITAAMFASIFIVLAFTGYYLLFNLRDAQSSGNAERFQIISKGYSSIYQQTLDSYIQNLETIRGLFYTTDGVLPDEFRLFAREIIKVYPEIKLIKWIPKVTHSERTSFEQIMQNSGYPGFVITELTGGLHSVTAQQRDDYYPVMYIEPLEANLTLVGHDLSSTSSTRKILNLARDSGDPIASLEPLPRITASTDKSIVIALPTYHSRDIPKLIQSRRQQLSGFIIAYFMIEESFRSAMQDVELLNMSVQIHDITDRSNKIDLAIIHNGNISQSDVSSQAERITSIQDINFSGRNWQLILTDSRY